MVSIGAARAAPPPLDAYGDLPGIEDAAVSPNGRQVAVVGDVQGKRMLLVYSGEKVRSALPVEKAKVRSVNWIDEDHALVVIRSTEALGYGFAQDKFDFYNGIVVSLDEQKVDRVFSRDPSMLHAIFGTWGIRTINGKSVGFFGGVELGRNSKGQAMFVHGRPALFQVDLPENSIRKVAPAAPENRYNGWLVDELGQVAATLEHNFPRGEWTIKNGRDQLIASGKDPEGKIGISGFTQDGQSIIYSRPDEQTGLVRYFEVPIIGGTTKELLVGKDVARLYVNPNDWRMIGYMTDSPRKDVFLDAVRNEAIAKVHRAFPNLDVRLKDWTPDFSHLLVQTSGNGDSGSWYLVDIQNSRADPIGSEYPLVRPEHVGPISRFEYTAADGMALDGILTLPSGKEARNLPVVVMPHARPNGRDEVMFDWFAQAFASRGYAVIQPNFRGSTSTTRATAEAGHGQWGRKIQTDISDALAAIAAKGTVDPNKACIVGVGWGGYSALAGVTLQNGFYRCAVAISAISDVPNYFRTNNRESNSNKMIKARQKTLLGDPSTYAEISPRRFAAQADAPVLLIHGKDDTLVEFDQSKMMASALQDAGKPHELILMKKEDHWLSTPESRKQALSEAVGFVQRYNPAE